MVDLPSTPVRVVIDTNVFVSGFLRRAGPPGHILDMVIDSRVTLLLDDRIIEEYTEVLHRPRLRLDTRDVARFLQETVPTAEFIDTKPLDVELPDADDLPFLEVAVAGYANGLVTGNSSHFIPIRGTHGMPIFSPRDFIDAF